MQQLTIYTREILKRTGYKKYPYKKVKEVIINYDGFSYSNCLEELDNPKLKIKFVESLKTSDLEEVKKYLNSLGRTDADKFIKSKIEDFNLER